MHHQETLYDFVTNLLSDSAARAGFADDPTGTLSSAGLQDVTPQDVQEVVPLVLAYAPGDGLASLEAQLSELPSDPEAAVQHLQVVAQSAAAGTVPAPGSLSMNAEGSGDPFSTALTGNGDLDGFTGAMTSESELGSMTGDAWGSTESLGATGTLGNDFGSGAAGARGDLNGMETAMVSDSPLGSFMGTSQLSADGAAGEFEAAGAEMGFASEGHFGASSAAVHGGGSADSELGSMHMHGIGGSDGFEFESGGDPSLSLDGDTLARGGEVAAGTVAGYVSSGGDAFASQISDGGEALGSYLTGAAETASEHIRSGSDYMAGHVSGGSHQLAGQIQQAPSQMPSPDEFNASDLQDARADLPTGAGMPSAGGLPAGDLPNPGVPSELPNLPVENPLPGDVQSQLPDSSMPAAPQPELPAAPQPSANTVQDGVSDSPLGNAVPQDAPTQDVSGVTDGELGIGG
ncbi:MAG: hypothetical protein GEU97_11005 [Actinophytocola sp.]|nr:hypothetical protein [Actinophytocola sp.]